MFSAERIRIDIMRIASYNMIERENTMPKRPREMEKEILDDGWIFKSQEGSHRHYVHPTKPGKVPVICSRIFRVSHMFFLSV